MPVNDPLSLGVCPACGTPVHRWKAAGIEYKADLTVVDAQQATAAVLAGRTLYRITMVGPTRNIRPAYTAELTALSGAEPPTIVGGHPCKAVTRPLAASQPAPGPGVRSVPPEPSAGRQTPSSGPQTESSGARTAETRVSDPGNRPGNRPECDTCGLVIPDGAEMVGIQIGELYAWARHAGGCPENGQNGA